MHFLKDQHGKSDIKILELTDKEAKSRKLPFFSSLIAFMDSQAT